jgi:phosphate transport system substrate-binding protein
MCGRYRRTTSEEEIARQYHIPILPQLDLPISCSIAPRVAAPSPASGEAPGIPSLPSKPIRRVVLRLHGSNTIGKELVPALCEEFLKFEGATSVQRKPGQKEDETDIEAVLPNQSAEPLTLEVQAHGSKTAFQDLAMGTCDIGLSSRRHLLTDSGRSCQT